MKGLSIRWRLTFWYAGALTTILVLFTIALLLVTHRQQMLRIDMGLRLELQELALEARLAESREEFLDDVQDRFFHHDICNFLITSADDDILFTSSGISPGHADVLARRKFDSAVITYSNVQFQDGYLVRHASLLSDSPFGMIFLQAVTSQPLYSDLVTLSLVAAVLIPIGIALAFAGGLFLARRALAPVELIANAAKTISISNLEQRIHVPNPNDELGYLAATLNSLIARLESAVKEIQRFTADASHELRTPLAVLRSEAESALRRQRTPEEYKLALGNIVDETVRLGRLADQLLDLSRRDAGIVPMQQETVRLDAILADVIDQLQKLAALREVALSIGTITACEVLGDDLQLRQAITNVIENAIKYTMPGGTVRVESSVRNGFVEIRIEDSGIGISAEHLPRVFERFYRVDSSRNAAGGIGLGLAIARSAVRLHGGEIQIQSTLGIGTAVTISIPGAAVVNDPHDRFATQNDETRTMLHS